MSDPVMTDHAELARLAEAASEGPWSLKEGSTPYPESDDADSWAAILSPRGHEVLTLYERYGVKGEDRSDYDDDAAFIAAANPARVLALLAEIAALRGRENELIAAHAVAVERIGRQRDEAVGLVGLIVGDAFGCNEDSCLVSHRMISDARAFLASLTADHVSDPRQMVSPSTAGGA